MFFKRSRFCGALWATERGDCPFSSTGYYSLSGFTHHPISEIDPRHPTEIVTQNLLESLAAENDRQRKTALGEARRMAQQCALKRHHAICQSSIRSSAERAMHYGFFASDAQRTELWQAAYRLYHELTESGHYTPDKIGRISGWSEITCRRWLEFTKAEFAFLRHLMSGNFSTEGFPRHMLVRLGHEYFDLPPKPGGEPVIAIPTITAEMSLEIEELEADSATESKMDEVDDGEDNTNAIEGSELQNAPPPETPKIEQLCLF
ncbi:hypothetical protein M2103_000572 [Ereboglobus sp. PH5-5]|uniref:hypothetical protein n=1 Tax=Ereboglobus sp. PH5-5 TaxID=2940529 RepID=UPI002405A53C|nr:hypothetical protein [Ereboglobus sp. PH5-5]MDF9832362.1 hypothetical protein [Ereboglobus sp. PH5-5]